MLWIHNNRSGRYKLLDKIDNVIYLLANRCGLTVDDYVTETGICNVLKTCKLQCLSFNCTRSIKYACINNIPSERPNH
jgi:hypothetical protein